MSGPYEDPAKTRMRAAVEIAIDQAGFSLVEPERIGLPPDSKIQGSLLGDIQSLDEGGVRTFYYLRPGVDKAVPKWIGNLARASHASDAGRVYVVVIDYSEELIESCKDVGVGLIRITDDAVFELVVDYDETAPRTLELALEIRLTEIRRSLERRVDLARTNIDARHGQAAGIIAGMEGDVADRYMNQFDAEYRNVDDWGQEMSSRLDALGPRSPITEVAAVEALISSGPPPVSEVAS